MSFRVSYQLKQPEKLIELLKKISSGLLESGKVNDAVKITAPTEIFSEETTRSENFYINPQPELYNFAPYLKLSDVANILSSTISFLQEDKEYLQLLSVAYPETPSSKIFEEANLELARFNNNAQLTVQDKVRFLKLTTSHLTEIVQNIKNVEKVLEEEKEALQLSSAIPPRISKALWSEVSEQIPIIREVLDAFEFSIAAFSRGEEFKGIDLGEQEPLSVITVRQFLNTWLKKTLDENQRKTTEQNPALNRQFRQFPLFQQVIEQFETGDIEAIKSFREVLSALEGFKPATQALPDYSNVGSDESGGEGQEVTKNLKDEELLSLIESLDKAGISYRDVALRMQNILLPQFFQLHNIDPTNLEINYKQEYNQLRKELTLEIERILHNMDAAELKSLNNPEGRLLLLRKLYGRLSANPRFITYSQQIKTKYVGDNGLDENAFNQELGKIDGKLDGLLRNSSQTGSDEWTVATTLSEFAKVIRPNEITKDDFEYILRKLNVTNAEDIEKIFSSVDATLFLRITPDRLRTLDATSFQQLFGVGLNDNVNVPLLCAVLSEYLYFRREWIAKTYNKDSIAHSEDTDLELGTELGAHSIHEISLIRDFARGNSVETKHLIAAASLSPGEIDELSQTGHIEESEIKKAFELLLDAQAQEYSRYLQALSDIERDQEYRRAGFQITPNQAEIRKYLRAQNFSYYEGIDNQVLSDDQVLRRGQFGKSPLSTALKVAKGASNFLAESLGSAAIASAIPVPGIGLIVPRRVNRWIGYVIIGTIGGAVVATIGGLITLVGGLTGGFGLSSGGAASTLAGQQAGAIQSGTGTGAVRSTSSATSSSGTSQGLLSRITSSATSTLSHPAVVGTLGLAGGAILTPLITSTTMLAAFLPPLPTIGANGFVSPYVTITKQAQPVVKGLGQTAPQGLKFKNEELDPSLDIAYTVTIKADKGYDLDISSLSDTFSFVGNADKRKGESDPTLPTSPLTFEALKNAYPSFVQGDHLILHKGDEIAVGGPGRYEDSFNKSFHDANVTNTIAIKFDATGGPGPEGKAQLGSTAEVLCLGECPQNQKGCWPTSGQIVQDPFGAFDHGRYGEDAFDISAVTGTPVYAPFTGNACADYNDGGYDAITKIGKGGFGNVIYLYVTTPEINSGNQFHLTFGHLSAFEAGLKVGQCVSVKQGDPIGLVGSTGFSTGPHLHYQYGPDGTRGPVSILRTIVPPAESGQPADVIQSNSFVRSCYDKAGGTQ